MPARSSTRSHRPSRGRALTLAVTSAAVAALLVSPLAPVGSSSAAPTASTASPAAAPLDLPVDTLGDKLLTVEFAAPEATLEAGRAFTVSGTVSRVTQAAVGRRGAGTPATFTLAVTDVQGTVLGTQDVTTADDGSFTTTVPASLTDGLAGADDVALALRAVDASADGGYGSADAGAASVTLRGKAQGLRLTNSFVSSVGWVKPGQTYPSRILVTNPSKRTVKGARVTLKAPKGTAFRRAAGPGTRRVTARTLTWRVPALRGGRTATLVVTSKASSLKQLPTVVWRDLSTRASLAQGRRTTRATSHGPKVIPPAATYDTARYGDRPFPIIPVQYTDRAYVNGHDGLDLARKINSPAVKGSTFNLFQEMSLKQLYPRGTVPSAGIATAGFDYAPGFEFQGIDSTATTCTGATLGQVPGAVGSPLYSERITDGVYNLPGQTQFYGADANGSAVVGSLAGVAALAQIDSGCGFTGKLVADAVAVSDPDIDFSDFDTDKDGVVDFFMVVYAGCGGNGASQLAQCSPAPSDAAPYDNIWPHSSSLEGSIVDPVSGLTGYTTDDQLKDLTGKPLFYTSAARDKMTTKKTAFKVFVRVGPYNVNPETAIDKASVISHEYGHSLGLPDFYSGAGRETYGDWNLMATDKSQNMDAFSRQELGWVVPEVLTRGKRTIKNIPDSKQDTGTISWRTPAGKAYRLKRGRDGIVHNSRMYVAKLPGRELLSPSVFSTGAGASKSHVWYSGSGNDFGCVTDDKGHNFDLSLPRLSQVPAGTPVTVEFKSNWDIEWDFDYGYVLTSGTGKDFRSHASQEGYTTSNTDPLAGNPNQNGCQAALDNGITGTSGSYDAGTEVVDRKSGATPPGVFVQDSYDISDLAGTKSPTLRFSYSTDPGLARPGWFIDDVVVKAGGRVVYRTDFEKSGGPTDPFVFNGGCQPDNPGAPCTEGWQYVKAGAEAEFDHAYYLEMRDRSGFDLAGNGEIDRDPIGFQPGLYLSYTDEARGYGNTGSDGAPVQSPLDSTPDPGNTAPNLDDAAYQPSGGRSIFSDTVRGGSKPLYGHTDNYTDPSNSSTDPRHPGTANPWRFTYDCLSFRVLGMRGQGVGPARADGDLTGTVRFVIGKGCGRFGYGLPPRTPPRNSAPVARVTVSDTTPAVGQAVRFSAARSSDAQTPRGLDYTWSFDDGGPTKDASGVAPTHRFTRAGTYDVLVRVGDPRGLASFKRARVTVG